MLSTIRRFAARLLRRAADNEIRRVLEAQDFDRALELLGRLPAGMRDDVTASQFRVHALIGLNRFAEAIETLNRMEGMELSDIWRHKVDRLRWRALYGMNDYDSLSGCLSQCRSRHLHSTSFVAYELLLAYHRCDEASFAAASDSLLARLSSIDEAWQLVALWSALRWLNRMPDASRVAETARRRFSNDPGVQDIVQREQTQNPS